VQKTSFAWIRSARKQTTTLVVAMLASAKLTLALSTSFLDLTPSTSIAMVGYAAIAIEMTVAHVLLLATTSYLQMATF
jgi:hypothetical protein